MEFRLLGPFEASHRGAGIDIRGHTYPKILSILLLEEGCAVSTSQMIDALWDDAPPATAARQVRNRVASLRRLLNAVGADPIQTVDGGYRLPARAVESDCRSFVDRVRTARAHAAAGRYTTAAAAMGEALSLWRGPALMGMSGRVYESAACRLEESRLSAVEARLEWELQLGRHERLVAELTEHVAERPYRQRLVGLLMRALHRSGRTAEALDTYIRFREQLAAELGIDPSRRLQALYTAILRNSTADVMP
ncbi:MAG: AfsR/SARP family transcriptional regulator [Stackebrandtia sp.]